MNFKLPAYSHSALMDRDKHLQWMIQPPEDKNVR